MRVVEETLLVPMVLLEDGSPIPYDRSMDRPYKPVRIDHYYSRLVVEIEGRQAFASAQTPPELFHGLPRGLVEEDVRATMQDHIVEFIRSELFK